MKLIERPRSKSRLRFAHQKRVVDRRCPPRWLAIGRPSWSAIRASRSFGKAKLSRLTGSECSSGAHPIPGALESHSASLFGVYYPAVNYGRLVPGATFEVVEGPKVVGVGHVLSTQA